MLCHHIAKKHLNQNYLIARLLEKCFIFFSNSFGRKSRQLERIRDVLFLYARYGHNFIFSTRATWGNGAHFITHNVLSPSCSLPRERADQRTHKTLPHTSLSSTPLFVDVVSVSADRPWCLPPSTNRHYTSRSFLLHLLAGECRRSQ